MSRKLQIQFSRLLFYFCYICLRYVPYLKQLFWYEFSNLPFNANPAAPYISFFAAILSRWSTENFDTIPQFGILLAGGATDNDDGMDWLAKKANGGDVVVLRASGSDGYNDYIHSELGVEINSVTSIVIIGSAQANNPEVCQRVENAEMIFIAGGNQKFYYNEWKAPAFRKSLMPM